jgi:hypothetical protein
MHPSISPFVRGDMGVVTNEGGTARVPRPLGWRDFLFYLTSPPPSALCFKPLGPSEAEGEIRLGKGR